jgi:hypothetical protein
MKPPAEDLAPRLARLLTKKTPPSLEWCITLAGSQGLRVNNLFQTSGGFWQANVRRSEPPDYFDFAQGDDPARALLGAIRNTLIRGPKSPHPLRATIGSIQAAEVAEPLPPEPEPDPEPLLDDDDDDLLG